MQPMTDRIPQPRSCPRGAWVLAVCLAHTFAAAATFVVDGESPGAAGDNPGTAEHPWKTISRAGSAPELRPGDTVLIQTGVYRESVHIRGLYILHNRQPGGQWSMVSLGRCERVVLEDCRIQYADFCGLGLGSSQPTWVVHNTVVGNDCGIVAMPRGEGWPLAAVRILNNLLAANCIAAETTTRGNDLTLFMNSEGHEGPPYRRGNVTTSPT